MRPSPPRRTSPRSTSSTIGTIPNAMEPRAAVGEYDSRDGQSDALHDEPEPARGARGAVRVHRHRAGEQAARDRARRRRRLRLQDFHLRRRDGLRLGGAKDRSAGQMDLGSHGGLPLRRARPRPCNSHAELALDAGRQDHRASRAHDRQHRRLYVHFLVRGADLSVRPLLSGQYATFRDLRRSRWPSTPTPRRSTPIAARAGRRRRSSSSAWSKSPRANSARDPAEFRRANFVTVVPAPDAGDRRLRHRRLRRKALDKALELADYKGVGGAQGGLRRRRASCAASDSPPISKPAASRRRRRSAAMGAGVGQWESAEKCGSTWSAPSKC